MPGAPCPVIFLGAAMWRTRTTGLAFPSGLILAQQLLADRNPRDSSSHAMNATHGDRPRASVTPRLHLRTRVSSRHSSVFLSSTHRDRPRDCLKRPTPGGTLHPTYIDHAYNLGHWFRRRLTPGFLPIPQTPSDPRHLLPASELPSLPTYSRPPFNMTSFHPATRFRSSSCRRCAPGNSHTVPLHRDALPRSNLAPVSAVSPTGRPTTCPIPIRHVPREPPVLGPPPFPPSRYRFSPRTRG